MNTRQFNKLYESVCAIEKEFDVQSLTYHGVCVWPLIRCQLGLNLVNKRTFPQTTAAWKNRSLTRKSSGPMESSRSYASHAKALESLKSLEDVECLFYCPAGDYVFRINGLYYNFYLDPYFEFINARHASAKLEVQSTEEIDSLPLYHDAVAISNRPHSVMWREYNSFDPIENLTGVLRVAERITGGRYLNEEGLERAAFSILRNKDYFSDVLAIIKPKALFLRTYYSPFQSGIMLACKQAGVTTVDIQHANMESHIAYTHWGDMPNAGYDLAPDFLWTWGELTRQWISDSQPDGCERHRPLVGGNRWIAKCRHDIDSTQEFISDELLQLFESHSKTILLTLQRLNEDPILPDHVMEAIRQAPRDWLWLIRLHPMHRDPQRQADLKRLFEDSGVQSYEIDHASDAALSALLANSDYHLTLNSSTVYEALAMGVPSSTFHQEGLNAFPELYNDGRLGYGQTSEEIIGAIQNASATSANNSHIISTSDRDAINCLNEIMEAPQENRVSE